MRIVIAPYAAKLPENKPNPKNFPYWSQLVELLNKEGCVVAQLGTKGEERIEGVGEFLQGFPYDKIEQVIRDADTWISVDSWLPHFCAAMRLKPGIVIWSRSNPKIWGYPHNVNLLKDKKYLREYQYAHWWDCEYLEEAFVEPQVVMDALHGRLAASAS